MLDRCLPVVRAAVGLAVAMLTAAPTAGVAAGLDQILADSHVPGLSMIVIRNGKIGETTVAGVRSAKSKAAVDPETVFEAASLSKPVFAYAVLQLVDAGTLSLDDPLAKYVPDYVPKDPRAAEITVRQALSHSTGLPNWRSEKWPLKTYFAPGERYSYSSEGYMWLQRVVETVTGEPIEALMQRLVLRPLGMRRSSFVWQSAFDGNFADPHDAKGAALPKRKLEAANVAASLQTTAVDYARFVQAAMLGRRLRPVTARLWLAPQLSVRNRCFECLTPDLPDIDTHVAWALGWGLERDLGTFFQWGHSRGQRAFVLGSAKGRWAVIIFTDGAGGMSIMPEVVGQIVPGERPSLEWLPYPRYVPVPR